MRRAFVLALATASTACVDVYWTRYDPTRVFPRVPESSVLIYWTPPPFDVELIGDMTIKPCPACDEGDIRRAVRPQAARVGADVVVIVDQSTRFSGAVITPNQWTNQVYVNAYQRSTLRAIMGKRRPPTAFSAPPVPRPAPPPPAPTGRAALLRVGMSQEEVKRVLGPPQWHAAFEATVRWSYPDVTVIFESGRVNRFFQSNP